MPEQLQFGVSYSVRHYYQQEVSVDKDDFFRWLDSDEDEPSFTEDDVREYLSLLPYPSLSKAVLGYHAPDFEIDEILL